MEHMDNNGNQNGGSQIYYVIVGILIAIGIFFAVKDYHDRNGDVTIHIPRVEVH